MPDSALGGVLRANGGLPDDTVLGDWRSQVAAHTPLLAALESTFTVVAPASAADLERIDVALRWLEPRDLPVAVLLTKADKLSRAAGIAQERALQKSLGPAVKLARFSALTGDGVAEARAWIEAWLSGPRK